MTAPTRRPITKAQIRAAHAALARQGIDDETYRALLRAAWDASSCLELDRGQASDLLRRLGVSRRGRRTAADRRPPNDGGHARGSDPGASKRPTSLPPGVLRMATPAQRRLIGELRTEIDWRAGPDGYRLWLKQNLATDRVASSGQAARVIEGLKGLKRNRTQKQP